MVSANGKMCDLSFCLLSWRNSKFNAINMFMKIINCVYPLH